MAWCFSGGELLLALEKQAAGLMVLDVGLPDGNGFELCKEMRKTSDVPVIFYQKTQLNALVSGKHLWIGR